MPQENIEELIKCNKHPEENQWVMCSVCIKEKQKSELEKIREEVVGKKSPKDTGHYMGIGLIAKGYNKKRQEIIDYFKNNFDI